MGNIVRIIRGDFSRLRHNVIALIVVVGLVVVPPLYAWFNIAGGWDPYGNTGGMKVAVANTDKGYKSDLIPVEVNIGETVVSQLRANDQLDWRFVSEDDAIEGVKAGEYYAAVVIPKDFSADMMTLFSSEVKHSKIVYYENQKKGAVSPEVTSQGASTIQAQVDETFAKTIANVGLSATSGLMDFMDSDQVAIYASHLSSTLGDTVGSLEDASGTMASFSGLLASTSSLVDSTSKIMQQTGGTSQDADKALGDAKSGLSDVKGAIGDSVSAINGALKQSASSYDSVSAAVEKAFAAGTTQATDSATQLDAIASKVDAQKQAYEGVLGSLQDTSLFPDQAIMQPAVSAVKSVIERLRALSGSLSDAATALRQGSSNANSDLASVKKLIAQAKGGIASVEDSFSGTLGKQAEQLASTVSGITSSASGISAKLDKTVSDLSGASDSLAGDLRRIGKVLDGAISTLTDSAKGLKQLKTKLDSAVRSGDLDQIRSVIGSDPEALADALAAPVALDEQAIYPMANNGSAMAPFYTTLSLWVGAIVLAAMCRADVSAAAASALAPVRPHELYLGRFGFFACMSFLQSTLVCAGDILFFGIQAINPLQIFGACWVASLVFCCIVYTLTVSFGDIGKAVAVVLLVMQVAASGGEFPIEMYEPVFQAIYPFLPFVHAMNAMRAGMAGAFGMEYWTELGTLALYLLPALALGLLFRRPIIRANQWIIRKLEDTKLM